MGEATGFQPKIIRQFAEILSEDLGPDKFTAVLTKAGLRVDWATPSYFCGLDEEQAAQAFSKLQSALRTYYGRGARGFLIRIGGKLWERLLNDAAFGVKAQAALVRGLPRSMRRKPALELLARLLNANEGNVTVHTLDLDLVFVDHASIAALAKSESAPICFVTLGLIRECLYWALGYEHDIEEISCRATGARECEFKITVGG